MMFVILPSPCVSRFDTNKALHEDRIKNEGDLPSKKLISKNALLAMILSILTAARLVQEGRILIFIPGFPL